LKRTALIDLRKEIFNAPRPHTAFPKPAF